MIGFLRRRLRWLINRFLDNAFLVGLIVTIRPLIDLTTGKYKCWFYSSTETILVDCQGVDEELPKLIEGICGEHVLAQPFVLEIPDVELIGQRALVRTAEREYLVPTLSRPSADWVVRTHTLNAWLPVNKRHGKTPPIIDCVAPLVQTPWCGRRCGYFHWITDNLTRLEGLEYYQATTGTVPSLLMPPAPSQWMIDSLDLMGFTNNQRIEWDESVAQVRRLIYPSHRTMPVARHRYNPYSVAGYMYVKQRILGALTKLPIAPVETPRIYISRNDAAVRRVSNEAEITETLESYGFVPYILSKLTFTEQVQLFAQAEVIVAPHGAGLINMIFSHRPALVEFYTPDFIPGYFILAKSLGFAYEALKSTPDGADLIVDPKALAQRVERLI